MHRPPPCFGCAEQNATIRRRMDGSLNHRGTWAAKDAGALFQWRLLPLAGDQENDPVTAILGTGEERIEFSMGLALREAMEIQAAFDLQQATLQPVGLPLVEAVGDTGFQRLRSGRSARSTDRARPAVCLPAGVRCRTFLDRYPDGRVPPVSGVLDSGLTDWVIFRHSASSSSRPLM